MTLSWIVPGLATALALLEAQKPEQGAGAYPQTLEGRPGWRQIAQAVAAVRPGQELGGSRWRT